MIKLKNLMTTAFIFFNFDSVIVTVAIRNFRFSLVTHIRLVNVKQKSKQTAE